MIKKLKCVLTGSSVVILISLASMAAQADSEFKCAVSSTPEQAIGEAINDLRAQHADSRCGKPEIVEIKSIDSTILRQRQVQSGLYVYIETELVQTCITVELESGCK